MRKKNFNQSNIGDIANYAILIVINKLILYLPLYYFIGQKFCSVKENQN